jgi:hypothetical protein
VRAGAVAVGVPERFGEREAHLGRMHRWSVDPLSPQARSGWK